MIAICVNSIIAWVNCPEMTKMQFMMNNWQTGRTMAGLISLGIAYIGEVLIK